MHTHAHTHARTHARARSQPRRKKKKKIESRPKVTPWASFPLHDLVIILVHLPTTSPYLSREECSVSHVPSRVLALLAVCWHLCLSPLPTATPPGISGTRSLPARYSGLHVTITRRFYFELTLSWEPEKICFSEAVYGEACRDLCIGPLKNPPPSSNTGLQ